MNPQLISAEVDQCTLCLHSALGASSSAHSFQAVPDNERSDAWTGAMHTCLNCANMPVLTSEVGHLSVVTLLFSRIKQHFENSICRCWTSGLEQFAVFHLQLSVHEQFQIQNCA